MAVEQAHNALSIRVEAAGKLAGQLDLYAGHAAANETKVGERLNAMEEAHCRELQALEAVLQSKLGTVDSTFMACDAALKVLH